MFWHLLTIACFWLPLFGMCVYAVGKVNGCFGVDRQGVCHEKAICHDELEGGVYCVCMDGYVGDGFTCTGTILQ